MPENQSQKYVAEIPRFVLPAEFSNEPVAAPEVKPEVKPTPTAEPLKEAKPATEAVATEPEPEKEPEKALTEGDPEKQSSRRFERRIDRAHRRAAEAQARAEFLEKENASLKAQSTPKTPTTAPQMKDFTDVQEYAEAYAAHQSDQKLREFRRKQQEDIQKAQVERISEGWDAQVSKAQEKYEDWDEVVGELKPTTPWSAAMMRADNGADIAHHLGSHPAEAKKMMSLDPFSQILEIGRLSAKLQAGPERAKTPSAAPKPISPVSPVAKPSGDEVRPDQPFEEYRKVGNKMFARGRQF